MVTLKDVGELAGVTATTASAALRGKDYVKPETTQRVRDAARKLGYKINLSGRSLRSGRSDTITFLTSGLEGDYFSHLAMCVAEEVHKRDSHMLIELSRYLTDDNDLSYTFSDGIIAINAPRAVDILKRHPAVMLENYDTSLPVDTVNAPSDAGSRAAIEHLIARGCARIGIVGDNHDPNNPNIIPGSRDIRMRAAKETILAAGLPFDERRDFIKSSWSIDGGIEAGRRLGQERQVQVRRSVLPERRYCARYSAWSGGRWRKCAGRCARYRLRRPEPEHVQRADFDHRGHRFQGHGGYRADLAYAAYREPGRRVLPADRECGL